MGPWYEEPRHVERLPDPPRLEASCRQDHRLPPGWPSRLMTLDSHLNPASNDNPTPPTRGSSDILWGGGVKLGLSEVSKNMETVRRSVVPRVWGEERMSGGSTDFQGNETILYT